MPKTSNAANAPADSLPRRTKILCTMGPAMDDPAILEKVFLAKRDLRNARANFEKALELQPDYHAAAQSLAIIDIQEGHVEAARDRYAKLLTKHPNNEELLLGSAEIQRLSGAPRDKVKETLDKAVAANPTSVRARLRGRISPSVRGRVAAGARSPIARPPMMGSKCAIVCPTPSSRTRKSSGRRLGTNWPLVSLTITSVVT